MARTAILPTDTAAVKVWSAQVAVDAKKKSFWDKMTGGEDSALPVVAKTDLESGAGDEVTTTLIAKLRGQPVQGDEKLPIRSLLSHELGDLILTGLLLQQTEAIVALQQVE